MTSKLTSAIKVSERDETMRKITYVLSTGFAGCDEEDVMEFEDGTTDAVIDEVVNEMAQEFANGWEGDTRLYSDWDEQETEDFYDNCYGAWSDYVAE